ncbi:uncharacterized protein LOC124172068 [Ischnura elegans]|uniref:uncharacterized protein LOC124172068 n=1 Tax=Ischnura elegans TaxID=197161 RepID=UPI001ED87FAA|nr:uncharacterized protein LOC124172068 [Ischnura elegans]
MVSIFYNLPWMLAAHLHQYLCQIPGKLHSRTLLEKPSQDDRQHCPLHFWMPFVVAEFLPHRDFKDVTVQTIPACWIVGENVTRYPPPGYSWAAMSRLIHKEVAPKDNWEMLGVKFVSPTFDSYLEAVSVERKAAECSDTDLEVVLESMAGEERKRKRKTKNIRYPSEPITDTSVDEDNGWLSDPPHSPERSVGVHMSTSYGPGVPGRSQLPRPHPKAAVGAIARSVTASSSEPGVQTMGARREPKNPLGMQYSSAMTR